MDAKKNKGPGIFKNSKEIFQVLGNWSDQSKELNTNSSQPNNVGLNGKIVPENDMLSRVATLLDKSREEVINIIKRSQMG